MLTPIITLIVGGSIAGIAALMMYATRELCRMEYARRDLEGVEIDCGQVHDVVDPS